MNLGVTKDDETRFTRLEFQCRLKSQLLSQMILLRRVVKD